MELERKERHYIESLDCINAYMPGLNEEER